MGALLASVLGPALPAAAQTTPWELSGTMGSGGWYTTPVTLTFTSDVACYDARGADFTEVPPPDGGDGGSEGGGGMDGGSEGGTGGSEGGTGGSCAMGSPYTAGTELLFSLSGTYAVDYYLATDPSMLAGTVEFKTDRDAPTFTLPAGSASAFTAPASSPCLGSSSNGLYASTSLAVNVLTSAESASASSSGLVAAAYEIVTGNSSSGWLAATMPTTVTLTAEGNYTIRLNASDAAGNSGIVQRCIWIDRSAPPLTIDLAGPAEEGLAVVRVTSGELIQRVAGQRQATVALTAPEGATSTATLSDPLSPSSTWGFVTLGSAGAWSLTASANDEAGNAATSMIASVDVTPRSDPAGVTSLAASAFPGCSFVPSTASCDTSETRVTLVLDPGASGYANGSARLHTHHVAPDGTATIAAYAPTVESVDGAGVVTAWWNRTFGAGALAYRASWADADGAESSSAWRGVSIRDKTPPTLGSLFPSAGAQFLPGYLYEVTGSWGDVSGIDFSRVDVRLTRVASGSGGTTVVGTADTAMTDWGFRYATGDAFEEGEYTATITAFDNVGNAAVASSTFSVNASAATGSSSSASTGGTSGGSTGGVTGGGDCVGGATGSGSSGDGCGTTGGSTDGGSTGGSTPTESGAGAGEPVEDEAPPTLGAFGPTGRIIEEYPDVFASYSDASGVVPASVVLELDGVRLDLNATESSVRFTPQSALAAGPHTVALRVDDAAGNSLRKTWSFVVQPLPQPGARFIGVHEAAPVGDASFIVMDPVLGLESVVLTLDAPLTNLTLSAHRLNSLPATVTPLPSESVTLLDVSATADNGSVADALRGAALRFLVPIDVIAALDAQPHQVLALHFRDGAWTILDGGVESANGTRARFLFSTAGLSPFALIADTSAPTLTPLAPADGAILSTPPTVRVSTSDNVGLAGGALLLDGVTIGGPLALDGLGASIERGLADVPDGRHTLEVRVSDAAGNSASRSWTFILDREGPTFPSASPEGTVQDARDALIEVALVDAASGVDPATVRVRLDGLDVTAHAVIDEHGVTLDPAKINLAPGTHRLEVSATDRAGNSASLDHEFHVAAGATIPSPAAGLIVAGAAAAAVLGTIRRRR